MTPQDDGQELRRVMRNIPSPVAVLTFASADGPRGVTIGSFTSLSLDPPLVSFNLMDGRTAEEFLKAQYFGIHVLNNIQSELSDHFARPDLTSEEQFKEVEIEATNEGVPSLTTCMAVLICRKYEVLNAGDHILILGEVLRSKLNNEVNPLLYYQRSYHEIREVKLIEE